MDLMVRLEVLPLGARVLRKYREDLLKLGSLLVDPNDCFLEPDGLFGCLKEAFFSRFLNRTRLQR